MKIAIIFNRESQKVINLFGIPNREKVGKVSAEQVRKIAETKLKDLNAYDLENAEKIIKGTAQSMGIEIVD